MSKSKLLLNLACGLLLAWLAGGCSAKTAKNPQQRYDAAKALFEQTTKQYHTPLAEASAAEKEKLQREAAAGYEQLLKKYSDQEFWAAQAMRNLAGIRATEGKVDQAVKLYASVEQKYPKQDWEILTAWKAAGDLLWENRRPAEAKPYYQKIIAKFDKPDAPQVVKTVVRGSKLRLEGRSLPGETTGS